MKDKRILVIGDVCIDRFVYCEFSRICPEAPVPVLVEKHTTQNAGMAANVSANLSVLGMKNDLASPKNSLDELIKTRYVDQKTNHMFFRCDNDRDVSETFDINSVDFSKYDGVIVSDYDKGFLTREIIDEICKRSKISFVDTKKPIGDWANPTFFKINKQEWIRSGKYNNSNVIVTLGQEGCMYRDKVYCGKNVIETFDVSGAGDTFLSAFACAYVYGCDVEICLSAANFAAQNVVTKKGVSVPDYTLDEIIKFVS